MPTSDAALAIYLGIENEPNAAEIIANLRPERRASYERMIVLERAVDLWLAGKAPMPKYVLIDIDDGRAIFQ